jgi:uncharacterized protein (TIGR02145 family)
MMQYSTSQGVKGICPSGWHIPTDAEWITATTFLGGENVAGGKMKATGTLEATTGWWNSPNMGATNESGFTAFPAGLRSLNGPFWDIGYNGNWWSSSEDGTSKAWILTMYYDVSNVFMFYDVKNYGYSVRCVRDL